MFLSEGLGQGLGCRAYLGFRVSGLRFRVSAVRQHHVDGRRNISYKTDKISCKICFSKYAMDVYSFFVWG